MTALARIAALACALATGCTGEVSVSVAVGPESEVEAALRAQFETTVEPILIGACGGCHDNGGNAEAPQFMATDLEHREIYDQVVGWIAQNGDPLVDVNAVGDSYLLRKGMHGGGRAFHADELEDLLRWIQAESDYANTVEYFKTDGFDVVFNANTIELRDVGLDEFAGTILTFDYNSDDTVLFFNNLQITAGPTGIFLKSPLIVPLVDGVPVLEPFERFETVMLDLAFGETGNIGAGSEAIAHLAEIYTPSNRLQIAFYFRELRPQ